MEFTIQIEIDEDMVREYLFELGPDKFCEFMVRAELDHECYDTLVNLIRHYKFMEESLNDEELLECGDLSAKEIRLND